MSAFSIPVMAAWLAAVTIPSGGALERGDLAWDAGEYQTAVAAYDSALAANPSSVRAAYRIGLWHSWENRLDSALVMIRRARSHSPADADLALAEARLLSWAGRARASVALYDSILVVEPERREARLGRAKSLAWGGQLAAADAAYTEMLLTRPNDADALGGAAQVASWRGRPDRAEALYRQAIDSDPRSLDAWVGLARLHHQQWRVGSAARGVERALALDPRSSSARRLADEVRAARRPLLEMTTQMSSDSDHNLVWTRGASSSAIVADGLRVFGSLLSQDATDPVREASGAGGEIGFAVAYRWLQATAAGGARLLTPSEAPAESFGSGRVAATARVLPGAILGIGFGRRPFDDNAQLIGSRIEIEELEASLDSNLPWSIQAGGRAARARLSDGNQRVAGSVSLMRPLAPQITAGVAARVTEYDRPGVGYFSPDRFSLAEARGSLTLGRGQWGGSSRAGLGAQQVGRHAAAQIEWHLDQSLVYRWGPINQVELTVGASNSASSSSTGAYSSFVSGLAVRIGL